MAATFLVKLHSDRVLDAPGAPKAADAWEGVWLNIKAAPTSTEGRAAKPPAPQADDKAYVWIHESERGSTGRGLTALAGIDSVRDASEPDDIEIRLRGVRLLDAPTFLGFSELGEFGARRSRVAAWVSRFAHRQSLHIQPDELEEWEAYLQSRRDRLDLDLLARKELEYVNEPTRRDWTLKVSKQLRSVNVRAGQGEFREAVVARYGGACALTGEMTAAALDAAHIIPVAEDTTLGRSPENGICLRADLHRLFDRGLIWFEQGRTVIADSLRGSGYEALNGRRIDPAPHPMLLAARAEAIRAERDPLQAAS
ncbi:MAG: HNH endonuclease [Oceanicaulis sp.]